MSSKSIVTIAAFVVAIFLVLVLPKLTGSADQAAQTRTATDVPTRGAKTPPQQEPDSAPATKTTPSRSPASTPQAASTVGFGSRQAFDEHYEKHGAEFGSVTQSQYLALAQSLRDAPVGGAILEAVRDDGVISRFDKHSGAFIAFNRNKTIRTFFKPNDGVRYFERQIEKAH